MSVGRGLVSAAVAALCVVIALPGKTAPAAPSASKELRVELSRHPLLARRVTISAERLHLGDLLERVSAATGVKLQASERYAALSGYEIAADVKERPVGVVLDSIVRLYSSAEDRWYWSKDAEGGGFTLRNSQPPSKLAAARLQREHAHLLTEWRDRVAFATAGPEGRAAILAANPEAKAWASPQGEVGNGFLAGLSPAAMSRVLEGNRLAFGSSALSAQQKDAVRAWFRQVNGSRVPPQPPFVGDVQIKPPPELTLDDATAFSLEFDEQLGGLPSLSLGVKTGDQNIRMGLLGGFNRMNARQTEAYDDWVAADELTQPEERSIPAPGIQPRPGELLIQNGAPMEAPLLLMAKAGGVEFLYDRPISRPHGFYRFFNTSIEGRLPEVFPRLRKQNLIWKRKNDLYWFRLADWRAIPRAAQVPWPVIRELRASAAATGGYLTLQDWMRLAQLPVAQREQLRAEFPDAQHSPVDEFADAPLQVRAQMLRFNPPWPEALLRLMATMTPEERAALDTPEGAGWEQFSRRTREALIIAYGRQDAATARISFRWRPKAPVGARDTAEVHYFIATQAQPMQVRFLKLRKQQPTREAPAVVSFAP